MPNEPDLGTLAGRFKWARRVTAVGPVELSTASGLSRAALWMIESGETPNPRPESLEAIAKALGVSAGWLAFGEGDPPELPAGAVPTKQDTGTNG